MSGDVSPILVAHAYFLRNDPKQWARMKPYPPLATALTAGVLRERGHGVRFFDAMLAPGLEAFEAQLRAEQPRIVALVEDNFNFLTKMCTTQNRAAALGMICAARSAGARVLVNGSDATDHPAMYLEAGADAVVIGEPEHTVAEVVDAWCAGHDAALDRLRGLVLADRAAPDGLRRTPARHHLTDLDCLPLPAWDLVDAEVYRAAWQQAHGRLSWSMSTARGCPYRCNWCAKPLFGSRYVQRRPESVVDEMVALRDTVKPDHLWFTDDIFGLTPEWIAAFAHEVDRRAARIPFTIQSRVNLMRPAAVRALAAAGVEEVWLGVESGSQAILDAMDKGTTVDEVRAATRALRAAGVRACWFIQLGYLGETWDDIARTRDLIRDERPDDIGVSVSYPLPGTKFHAMVQDQLGAKRNWRDSGDLAMMFHGTYGTAFYRQVRDALHLEVTEGPAPDDRWADLERQALMRSAAGASTP